MSNYFQKIASRSVVSGLADNSPSQNILPEKPVFFNEKQNDIMEEVDPPSKFITNPPGITPIVPSNLNYKSGEEKTNKNLIQPQQPVINISSPEKDQKNYPLTKIDHSDYSNPDNKNILQPAVTVIEKISQRNFQNTIIEKGGTEIKLPKESIDNKIASNLIVPSKENIQGAKDGSKKVNRVEASIATYKELQPELPLQKLKERLIPVQKDSIPLSPMKKAKQENKLVIGRITVEVINQVQPSTKPKEQTTRPGNSNKISNTEFTGINKLSFGLGQL